MERCMNTPSHSEPLTYCKWEKANLAINTVKTTGCIFEILFPCIKPSATSNALRSKLATSSIHGCLLTLPSSLDVQDLVHNVSLTTGSLELSRVECGTDLSLYRNHSVNVGYYYYIIVFVQGESPTPPPFSSRPHFVCKFSHQGSTKVF